jgi:hypothetical protein
VSVVSVSAAGLCLALSIWLFFASAANTELQHELQTRQESNQTLQQAVKLQQQQLEAQQKQIETGTKLAQEVGPAVLRDLGALALKNENARIRVLLAKYGVTATVREKKPGAKR